jgi:uncharacterized membrane protein
MQVPLHPMIVHFPLAISYILPVLIVVFAYMIKNHKMTPKAWLIIVGIQLAVVGSGYISLETGETEEHTVEKVVDKQLIHEHEEAAEIFVGSTVLALVLSIGVFFIRKEIGFPIKLGIAVLGIISGYLAFRTGNLGGELVYKHGAAGAYVIEDNSSMGILPTPGLNTSESAMPANENESLKADENDYGPADEVIDSTDDDAKQED